MQYFIIMALVATATAQCEHPIFCNSTILKKAADSNLFKDSKSFVDLPLKVSVEEALNNSKAQSPKDFIEENFHIDPFSFLTPTTFPDFKENPEVIDRIKDT